MTQIGVMNIRDKKPIGFLVNSLCHTNHWTLAASKVTGIYPKDVLDAAYLDDVLKWLIDFLTSKGTVEPILIAHNKKFDQGIIDGWIRILGISPPKWRW